MVSGDGLGRGRRRSSPSRLEEDWAAVGFTVLLALGGGVDRSVRLREAPLIFDEVPFGERSMGELSRSRSGVAILTSSGFDRSDRSRSTVFLGETLEDRGLETVERRAVVLVVVEETGVRRGVFSNVARAGHSATASVQLSEAGERSSSSVAMVVTVSRSTVVTVTVRSRQERSRCRVAAPPRQVQTGEQVQTR